MTYPRMGVIVRGIVTDAEVRKGRKQDDGSVEVIENVWVATGRQTIWVFGPVQGQPLVVGQEVALEVTHTRGERECSWRRVGGGAVG